ncbi:MAG: DUF262 domain-containing protein [Acidobacteria bacterium]|nr:DUF262 domain-containing protein [Acidobacteriota bacterium]
MELKSDFGERTINELSLMFKSGQINLEPGFQRNSVWTISDRRRLVQSILASYPVPCIFLYKRNNRGRSVYDVIDGKQRLETIFMFTKQGRFRNTAFDVLLDVTGKPLTPGERRHARFYTSKFLKEAEKLVSKYEGFFLDQGVLSRSQLDRMKGTELISELLMSIGQGGIINKKTALDRAISNESVNGNTLGRITREFTGTLGILKKMFPDLKRTRFNNVADFYSLFIMIWDLRNRKYVLSDKRRNAIASRILKRLSDGVDELREQLRRAKPAKQSQQFYARYLLTVQGDTDSAANRQRREEVLRGLLSTLFEYKDDKRAFSPEQRRLLWNSDEKPTCANCRDPLIWTDFTIDHVKSWTKGGKTTLRNAQLMCRSCNSRKGAS